MANLGQTFSTDTLPQGDSGEYKAIPAGWYDVTITEAGLNDTKSGTGQYIKLRYDITGPTHEGRVIFGNLNIRNQNPKAEAIGQQQLGDVMRAIGLASLNDTDQLVGGRLKIKVKVIRDQEYGDEDGNKNEVSGWKAPEGGVAPKPESKPADNTPPWLRK